MMDESKQPITAKAVHRHFRDNPKNLGFRFGRLFPFRGPKELVNPMTQTFSKGTLYQLPLELLQADPNQPRKTMEPRRWRS